MESMDWLGEDDNNRVQRPSGGGNTSPILGIVVTLSGVLLVLIGSLWRLGVVNDAPEDSFDSISAAFSSPSIVMPFILMAIGLAVALFGLKKLLRK